MGGHGGKELIGTSKGEDRQLLRSHRGWKPSASNSIINKERKSLAARTRSENAHSLLVQIYLLQTGTKSKYKRQENRFYERIVFTLWLGLGTERHGNQCFDRIRKHELVGKVYCLIENTGTKDGCRNVRDDIECIGKAHTRVESQ